MCQAQVFASRRLKEAFAFACSYRDSIVCARRRMFGQLENGIDAQRKKGDEAELSN